MTEALTTAPGTPDGITPQTSTLPNFDIPERLRRRTLKSIIKKGGVVPQKTWGERASEVEIRVKKIVATQVPIVESVGFNPPSTEKSDLAIKFKNVFPVRKADVEVKSSTLGLRNYKDDIIKDIEEKNGGQMVGPWARDLAREQWLVERNIILVNGGEKDRRERTTGEILYESFYPQLERIRAETQGLREKLGELLRAQQHLKYSQSEEAKTQDQTIQLFPAPEPIQIFPEAA